MASFHTLWSKKLDQLIEKKSAENDSALAKALKISRQKLNDARRGRQELPGEAKAAVVSALDEPISCEEYAAMFPRKTRESNESLIAEIYDPVDGEKLTPGFWVESLNKLMKLSNVTSDSALAATLGISPSMISLARQRKGTLSPVAKFKILDALGYMASRNLLIDLLPRKTAEKIKDYDNLRFKARGEK